MRIYLLAAVFIFLSANANAYWQTYQNDLKNTGSANGTGYFPLETANFSIDLGMDFQPLADDLNADGKNEIAIFANNSLVILNAQLNILAQAKIGSILGQPALFNFDNDSLVEIIFNSRQNSTDYFFAYQLNNSNLMQEFNITLSNEANFSGIKCLNLNEANSCVFKDRKNYVHIVDVNSKIDSYHNTSVYNETRQTVPAIGDIDNDGNTDAVFWFNQDNSDGYGFLAFDLSKRKVKWAVDNIFSPFIVIPGVEFYELFKLKGHPVLVDLNNDGKLEIAASVFYDDSLYGEMVNDWFTELHVYSYNGSKLFSICDMNPIAPGLRCNDGTSIQGKWDGTNPFILDYDKNGIEDICFIKDVKRTFGLIAFDYMALNCYNYSGDEIAKVYLTKGDGIKAILADINNDGANEIITPYFIYMLNGTSIFDLSLDSTNPIAVDIDGNNGLDLIWSKFNRTRVFLDSYNYSSDLSVDGSDISFLRFNSSHINVSAIIKNTGKIQADNVKAIVYNMDTLVNNSFLFNARRNSNTTISALLELKKGERILASADYDNEINESNEENNFAIKEFEGLPYVYVNVDLLEPVNAADEFADYIKNRLAAGYYTKNEKDADVKLYIAKNNPANIDNNIKTLNDFEFGYDYGNINFYDKTGTLPYNGLVGAFKDDNGKIIVSIVGNEIEGEIAAVKEFVKNQALFLNTQDKNSIFVDDENADAVKVYDYLHLGGNIEHYGLNDNEFKKIVRNALNDEMFNVEDKNVVASNGISLRLRNLKPNVSNDYLEYLNSTGMPVEMPVVLAHGLFSNLTTWEGLGSEISNTGRDTWLIEITGGPYQDCDDCIDYTFYNLTDIFVPALLNGVLEFTGKDKLQYVGFSNGCRSALDSLERNMFDSNKVETFVAVGCPGAFEGNSTLGNIIASRNYDISKNLNLKNINHPSISQIIKNGLFDQNYLSNGKDAKISLNLWKFYEDIITNKNDTQPGNIFLLNFLIIRGSALGTDDGIVTVKDENSIYKNVNKDTNSKKYFDVFALHSTLDGKDRTKGIIRKSLNKQELSFYEKTINLINESN